MEKRGHQQLRLQQTVEGLSVVAISYYLIGILSKLIDGFGAYAHVETKLVSLLSIPVVVFIVWYGVRRLREHILEDRRRSEGTAPATPTVIPAKAGTRLRPAPADRKRDSGFAGMTPVRG